VEILADGTIRVLMRVNDKEETKAEATPPKVRDFKL